MVFMLRSTSQIFGKEVMLQLNIQSVKIHGLIPLCSNCLLMCRLYVWISQKKWKRRLLFCGKGNYVAAEYALVALHMIKSRM